MKTKLTALLLALVLCMGLTLPVSAAAPTNEEALAKIEWTGSLTENSDLSPRDFDIQSAFQYQDPDEGSTTKTIPAYTVSTADEVFTVKHLGTKDDGSYIALWGYAYTPDENGVYCADGVGASLYMVKDRGLILWEEQLEGDIFVELHAGQSATFKLPTVDGYGAPVDLKNTIYHIRAGIYLPGMEGCYYVQSFIKIDPDAVAKIQSAPPAVGTGFTDVPANSPYRTAITWAVDQGITKGITADRFGTNKHCTIKQILTFLYRADGHAGESNDTNAVKNWAKSKGINVTEMDVPCTRSNAVSYIWKAAGSPAPKSAASFKDVPANADYVKAMNWAVEKGITKGTTQTTFGPNDFCTRGQIVTFLYRSK